MKLEVSIIIVHWNNQEYLQKLLANLTEYSSVEIIVVDNNSKIDAAIKRQVEKKFNRVTFIWNTANLGFAFACNQGAMKAHSDWLMFLNPDVEISYSQIKKLKEEALQRYLVAISPEPTISHYKKPLPTFWNLLIEFTPLGKYISVPSNYQTLTGGVLLIETKSFFELGGWDERFFLWFEDSDLTKKIIEHKYSYGWGTISFKHYGGGSLKKHTSSDQKEIFFQNLLVFSRKYFSVISTFFLRLVLRRFAQLNIFSYSEPGTAIIVPNVHESLLEDFFRKNWKTLEKSIQNGSVELVIVSNALSSVDFWEWKRLFPLVRFIYLKNNKGFADTVNIGFRSTNKEWLATVNDDTIIDLSFISLCEDAKKSVGSINPILVDTLGQIESAGITIEKKGKATPIEKIVNSKSAYEVDATNAAAVIYRRTALAEVGLFDTLFGSYLEDIDLSLRLTRNGWKNVVNPSSKVKHFKHQSSQHLKWKKQWLDVKNWWLVIFKNWSLSDLILYFPQILIERGRNVSGLYKALFQK